MISVGNDHTCGVRDDGTTWCWGGNGNGQLGDGTTTNRSTPVQVGADHDWLTVSAGHVHTCGVRGNGTAWCWGDNFFGQLGDGTTTNQSTPVQVGADHDWLTISAGGIHSCGIRANGTAWCWGDNGNGQLGDGTTTTPQSTPVQVGPSDDWLNISAGYLTSCGVRSDGTGWCWGFNGTGQLGDGTTINRSTPVQVGPFSDWLTISVGGIHSCGVRGDGTAWCWGDNFFGQLGDGTNLMRLSPAQVGPSGDWLTVSTDQVHSCGVKRDGTAWCWGYNGNGQLGDGTTTDRSTPGQVGKAHDWLATTTGAYHSCGVRSEVTAWCWGDNFVGQLGGGETANRLGPSQVASPWPQTSFGDVVAGSFYEASAKWAFANSVTTGFTATQFEPDQVVSRSQMALFLQRVTALLGEDSSTGPHGFTDLAGVSPDAQAAIGFLTRAFITGGTTPTTFEPFSPVTRWQMALFLRRAASYVGVPPYSAIDTFNDTAGLSTEIRSAIGWLELSGISAGVGSSNYAPQSAVTRGQMVTFLHRLALYIG